MSDPRISSVNPLPNGSAIETNYRGCRFRSRLEARWAVFFDALNIEWQYEPQGFEKRYEGGEITRYLPDFYLPGPGAWVEVKGASALSPQDAERMEEMLDWESPIPGIQDSDNDKREDGWEGEWEPSQRVNGMMLLGEIPDPNHGLCLHRIIRHRKGLCFRWFSFTGASYVMVWKNDATLALSYFAQNKIDHDALSENVGERFRVAPILLPSTYGWQKVKAAYKKARGARFEWGENGA